MADSASIAADNGSYGANIDCGGAVGGAGAAGAAGGVVETGKDIDGGPGL